jgi:hypothetical protein
MAKKKANPKWPFRGKGKEKRAANKAARKKRKEERKASPGTMNTAAPAPCKAQYKVAGNERVIVGPGCGYITLGKDRPDSQASGYGGDGLIGTEDESIDASRVEIVVGRMSSARKGKGVKPGTFVDNSFAADAARIYICETTDVDKNFGLVEGVVGNAVGKSTVAIKSDHTRIIGREGIKIVTGRMNNIKGYGLMGEPNSKGGKLPSSPGIDLIAGNNADPFKHRGVSLKAQTIQRLQPVAVAYNTRDCFLELSELLDDVFSQLQAIGFIVNRSNITAAQAFAALGALNPGPGPACAVTAGVLAAQATLAHGKVLMAAHASRGTKLTWETNFLQPYGYKFIGSRSVRATY